MLESQFEQAVNEALLQLIGEGATATEADDRDAADGQAPASGMPAFHLVLNSDMASTRIRSITAAHVNKLVVVPGIVVNASRTAPKATRVALRCRNCGALVHVPVSPAFGGFSVPRKCTAL